MLRPMKRLFSWDEMVFAFLAMVSLVLLRGLLLMLAVNYVLRPWTDDRIDWAAGVGLAFILTELSQVFHRKTDEK